MKRKINVVDKDNKLDGESPPSGVVHHEWTWDLRER